MAVKSPVASNLNPNAPLFVPHSYQMVDDFSPEWWRLVQTSPAFRDYWLRERQPSLEEDFFSPDDLFSTADAEDFLEIDMDGEDVLEQQIEVEDITTMGDLHDPLKEQEDAQKPGVASVFDMKDLVASLKIPETTGVKLSQKHQPLAYFDKPPKVVPDVPKKSAARRIQQPR